MAAPAELVASVYGAFNRGDVPAALGALDTEVEWRTPASLPWSEGTYRGRDGVARYFGAFAEALQDASVTPESIEGDGEVVVARGYERAAARPTGRRFEARFVHVWHVHGDRVVAMEGVADTAAIIDAFETPTR